MPALLGGEAGLALGLAELGLAELEPRTGSGAGKTRAQDWHWGWQSRDWQSWSPRLAELEPRTGSGTGRAGTGSGAGRP